MCSRSQAQFSRHSHKALFELSQKGKLRRLKCQVLRVDAISLPGSSSVVPLLWARHSPPGAFLKPYDEQRKGPSWSTLSEDAYVFPVVPLGAQFPHHATVGTDSMRWLRNEFTPRRSGDQAAYGSLRASGGHHPSHVMVEVLGHVQGAAHVSPQSPARPGDEAGEARELSLVLGSVFRKAPWWSSLPAWLLHRTVNLAAYQAAEALFITQSVQRHCRGETPPRHLAPVQPWQAAEPVGGDEDSPATAGSEASTPPPAQQRQETALQLLPPAQSWADWAYSLPSSLPQAASQAAQGGADYASRSVQDLLQTTGAAKAWDQVASSLPSLPWVGASADSESADEKAGRAHKPPPGFTLRQPPVKQAPWWAFWWSGPTPIAQPPHPEGVLSGLQEGAPPTRHAHPRDGLWALGSVSLAQHLAQHGAAVLHEELAIGLLAGQQREGAPLHFTPASSPREVAEALGNVEMGQSAAAVHGLGVWADADFVQEWQDR